MSEEDSFNPAHEQEQELLVQGLQGELDSLRQRVKLAEGASP